MSLTLPYSPEDIATLWPYMTPEERVEVEALVNELPIPDLTLKEFVREAWPLVEPASPFIDGWHIDVICDHLQAVTFGQIPNLIINIPPRHMKSLLTNVFWFCWEWTFQPWTRWMFASYSEGLVMRDSLRCRRIITSPWYQERWGYKFQLSGDQNQKKRFDNSESGFRFSTTVGGQGTGDGGNRRVIDDPLKAGDAFSDVVRESVNFWWDITMANREESGDSTTVLIMQRLHDDDLTGHILEKAEAGGREFEVVCLPAEYEPDRNTWAFTDMPKDPRTQFGELLWPERFSPKKLAQLKVELGQEYQPQYQQNPSPPGGGIWQLAWWQYWHPANMTMPDVVHHLSDGEVIRVKSVPLPRNFTEIIQSWDMSFKGTATSSRVCGGVWGRLLANKYLLDMVNRPMDFVATVKAVMELSDKWPQAKAKYVEDKANGPAVLSQLKGHVTGLIPVPVDGGDKVARAKAESPQIQAANVFLPHPHLYPWVQTITDQATRFPAAKFSDIVDMISQALHILYQNEVLERELLNQQSRSKSLTTYA